MKFLSNICIALLMTGAISAVHACTSWMVFSDLTKNNTNILHKNRDSKAKDLYMFISEANSPRKWVALGTFTTNSGINASGLAGAMNSGEVCVDPPIAPNKKTTPEILHVILESCDTAKQAVSKLKELVAAGDYSHGKYGSTFFFLDRDEGYVCELTAKYVSAQRYNRSYTVRANIWQNPDMYALSRSTIKAHLNSSARAYIAISQLNTALDKHKKITPQDIFAISRHCEMPKDSLLKRSVCGTSTNSASTIEIDRQYPGILSAMYVTIGHPRHTVFIPIPVCTEKLHPEFSKTNWSKATWARLEKLSLTAPIPAKWSKFEADSMAKFTAARERARKLLNAGKRAEAVKLLNTTAAAIWQQAAALMKL